MTDWSTSGIGFVILQQHCKINRDDDPHCCSGGWKLVLCGRRCLQDAEHNYAAIEGEALAIVWCFIKAKKSVTWLSSVYSCNRSQVYLQISVYCQFQTLGFYILNRRLCNILSQSNILQERKCVLLILCLFGCITWNNRTIERSAFKSMCPLVS